MRWRQPRNRPLAEAIVATLRDPARDMRQSLSAFSAAVWKQSWFWLDASGLSLYFLRAAEASSWLDAVDLATVQRLRELRVQNRLRIEQMFEEFTAINHLFMTSGVLYANVKGFTLYPDSCAELGLRMQLDLDFLVARRNLPDCKKVLEMRGYELTAMTPSTWEFKSGHRAPMKFAGPYEKSTYGAVELHFNVDGMDDVARDHDQRLNRLSEWRYRGMSVPALSRPDQLIGQALHVFAHLRSASTRPCWLLEFQRRVRNAGSDPDFWNQVCQLADSNPLAPLAMGITTLITTRLFGACASPVLEGWAAGLPEGVRLWVGRYGAGAVMADVPGTKFYLLLDRELQASGISCPTANHGGLLPKTRIPVLFRSRSNESIADRRTRLFLQVRFVLFRLRFHVVEGARYSFAALCWRRVRAVAAKECRRTMYARRAVTGDKERTSS